jgi:APA family basic amino acid/polyamine antiporter
MKLKLKREIGLFEVTLYGVGIILGAGIYVLIGKAAGFAGNSLWLSFLIGAFIASFTGLSYAELATLFPKAAAEYIYVRKAFGSRLAAYLLGWLIVTAGIISAATVALGFAGYFTSFFLIQKILVALILIAILSFINFLGIKESSRVNIIFTLIEVFGLAFIILIGLPRIGSINYLEMPLGFKGVLTAAALIFFAYIGFEDVVNIAEETKNPRKVVPRALLLAVALTTLIYILTSLSVVGLVGWKELSLSNAPLALAASKVFGQNAFLLLTFIALFATANTVLIILIVTARMLYGMAKEKSLPEYLARIHIKTRTPWISIFLTMCLAMLFVLLGDIVVVASLTNLVVFLTFLSVNLSLILLRYTLPKMHREFKVPLNIGRFPLLALFGAVSTLLMISQFSLNLILFGLFVIGVGLVFYPLAKRLA